MNGNSTYQQIIDQASIKDMLDYYGVEYDKKSNKYFCPFHSDEHASLSVTNDDKWFECMAGSCNEKGNIHNLVDKMEQLRGNEMDYLHIYDFIIKQQNLNIDFSLNQGKSKWVSPEQKKINNQINIFKDAKNLAVSNFISDNKKHGFASRYLASRGISNDTIKHFEIGYNEKSLIQDNLSEKYDNEELYQAGILGKSSVNNGYYDFQYDRILIPIKDQNGTIVGFGGRSLEENPSVKYKNTRETEIFKKRDILFNYNYAKYEAQKNDELIIVEGYFDVVSAYEMGIKNCVGLMGVAFSDEHKKLLKSIRSDNLTVSLCLDNDEAGQKAMIKIIPELIESGFNVNVIDTSKLDKGKDMNDFLCNGVTVDELNSVKMSAMVFLFQYYFNSFEKQCGKVDINTVYRVYNSIFRNEIFNNSLNEELFIEYVSNNYEYSRDSINNVIHPEKNHTLVSLAMQQVFYATIRNKLISIATESGNRVLQQFLTQGRLTSEHIMDGLNSSEYIKKNGTSIAVPKFCQEYLLNTKEYKEFEKMYDKEFDKLLDNVYGMDKSGNMLKIKLTARQRDIIQNQYITTFDDDIKEYFKSANNRFMKLFIADDINEFEQMLGKEYHFKVDALERFKTGSMCIINYGALFNMNDIEELNKTQPNVYTTENGDDFQAVFVYNNSSKELNLKPNQFIEDKDEIEPAHFDETFTQNGIPYTFNKQPQDRRMRNMSDRMRIHEARPSE